MKILLIQLVGKGGTQLYISQLASALSKTGNNVTLLLGNYLFDKNHYQNSDLKILVIDAKPSYKKMFMKLVNPITYYKILKIVKKENPDVIHLVFEDLISGVTFFLLKIHGYKLILTEHDPSPHPGEKLLSRLSQQTTKLLLRNIVDGIIVHGDNLKNIILQKGVSSNKIHVIPHGDYFYYTKWSRQLSEEKNLILFFGLIRDYKGLEYLIRSMSIIASYIPDIKLVIAGEGDFSKYYTLIENKKYFEIHNRFILDEEVAEFFERSSVVVLPYIGGSQSGVVPIAYAFKKPVVVTNVGSIGEIVEDGVTGLLIPPKNSNALAEAIIKILMDSKLGLKMGENGYLKMKNESSWSKIADKTIGVYKQ